MSAGRIPKDDPTFISWARTHADIWSGGQGSPPVIGLDPLEVASFEDKTAAAEAAYQTMLTSRQAALDATAAKDVAFAALRSEASADLARIDAYATTTNDPGVYPLAGIPEPKSPSVRPAPGAPTDLRTGILTDGRIELTFKVSTGGGATYLVQRRITSVEGVAGDYQFLGFADDDKRYIDTTVPEGAGSVGYRVAARLSTGLQGEWSQTATIPFGTQTGPLASIAPESAEDRKAAG